MGLIVFMLIATVVVVLIFVGARRYPKEFLIGLGVLFVLFTFLNCSGENTNTNTSTNSSNIVQSNRNSVSDNSFEYMDINVKFLESKIEYDSIDRENLVLYFQFTNNSKENQAFCYNFIVSAFQNGVALDDSYFYTDSEASRNYEREIQPGTSIIVSYNYQIKDKTTPIQIEITPFSVWTDRKLLEFTVNPS